MADHAITMKDIAEHFGVSINTVHKAVAGKPGVSEATRRSILAYAEKHGYRRNMEASALRRKNIVVAVCLPALTTESRFFYGPMWQGCHEFAEEYRGQGIRVEEYRYEEGRFDQALEALAQRAEGDERLDGLVTVPSRSVRSRLLLERIVRAGARVVFTSGDEPAIEGRYGSVMADFEVAGALMAEQARNLLPDGGNVLLMAGDAYKDSHYRVARSFHESIETGTFAAQMPVRDLFGYHDGDRLASDVRGALESGKTDLVCCVFARGSAALHEALSATGLSGKIPVIASDVFDETIAGMRDNSFTNLVYKDPRRQAYLAMRMVGDSLLTGIDPEQRIVRSRVSMVFRSTLGYFEG